MGIMSVVTDMGADTEDEREPTWDEAMAALDAAAPLQVVRSPRQVTVVYRYAGGVFTATSPEVKGFRVTGTTLSEVKRIARGDLGKFLDPSVQIAERGPNGSSGVCTVAASRSRLKFAAFDGISGVIVLSSSGTAGSFVASARTSRETSPHRVRRS